MPGRRRPTVLNHWGPWAGYMTALCFGDTEMEYTAIRNAASVYDLCPMVKYAVARAGCGGLSEPADGARCGQAIGWRGAVYRLVR